jgi:hypothetical protein
MEGTACADTNANLKSAFKTFVEGAAGLDSISKLKAKFHSFIERCAQGDWSEIYNNLVNGHKYNEYPAIKVENESR